VKSACHAFFGFRIVAAALGRVLPVIGPGAPFIGRPETLGLFGNLSPAPAMTPLRHAGRMCMRQ
jgi:hypothetical protein